MTYIVVLTQAGGCDYTIGCGVLVEQLSAKNLADAVAEAEEMVRGYHGGEVKLSGARIYEVCSSVKVDVPRVYADWDHGYFVITMRNGAENPPFQSRAEGRSVEALLLDIEGLVAREPQNYFKHLLPDG